MTRLWTALPNFVDCEVFRPAADVAGKQAFRQALGVPADAFVVGCVAAVKKHHKRIDYLIREFAQLGKISHQDAKTAKEESVFTAEGGEENSSLRPLRLGVHDSFLCPFLLIVGAKTGETDELIALAESLIPGRYKIMTDLGRDRMPDLYRAMDVFVLTSLFEMMPIALLEALASGLPCLVNRHPVLEWMIGAEGEKPEHQGAKGAKEESVYACGEESNPPNTAVAVSSPLPPLRSLRLGVHPSSSINGSVTDMTREDELAEALGGLIGAEGEKPEHQGAKTAKEEIVYTAEGGGENSSLRPLRLGVQTSSLIGGIVIEMNREGALAAALAGMTAEWVAEHGWQARERALQMFSREVVIGQYIEYYRRVCGMRE